MPKRGLQEDDS